APRAEDVSIAAQCGAHVVVVVELAVLDRPDVSVLVRERLVAGLDVDDAQAPRAEGDPRREMRAAVVRAAVRHRVGHPVQQLRRRNRARRAADLNDPTDPAHRTFTLQTSVYRPYRPF